MSQRFIRCPHCGMPHDGVQVICPSTGKAIRRDRSEHMRAAEPAQQPPSFGRLRAMPSTTPPKGPSRDLIGRTIGGKYVVRNVLGEGGMGTVFEAEHLTIGRSVAVKVLHPTQARKKDAVRRFHQEARAAGAIGHPNICEVYDLGTLDDGSPYLVMEKLVGETLADRIASEGGLPFDDVIDVLVQVLSGLVAAHEKGIVHRDIKPENVFLTRRVGCPALCKLLDFGVSKMITPLLGGKEEDLDLTRTGMVMGTPYYMSPEQARGDRNLDVRVDLYACGVILYEALTGRRPFTAANYNALLLQILSAKPRPARDLRPALPMGFDAVLEKAMARSREDRYRSAAEFQRELQTLRDRFNAPPPGILGEALRQLQQPKPSSTLKASPPPPPMPPPPPSAAVEEPTPSSVEIPITFSSDTPLSGENLPVDATELLPSQPPPPMSVMSAEDAAEFEELPTQVHESSFDDQPPDDGQTTQRRGPEFAQQLAQARGGIRDTDVMGMPAAVHDTDATGRPAALRTTRKPPEARDDGETIIKSRSAFPLPKRKPPRSKTASSPDDTVQEVELPPVEGDPTQLMASRAPKAPRR
jgi:serine/threonine-protein kinase